MCLRVPALYSTVVHFAGSAQLMYAGFWLAPLPVHLVKKLFWLKVW